MNSLIRLVYVSEAVRPLTRGELETLSGQSADRNKTVDVTGMLLYSSGTFVQCLEGRQQQVMSLYRRIECDPRHERVMQVACDPIKKRLFGHWFMGLLNLDEYAPRLSREQLAVILRTAREGSQINVVQLLKMFRDELPAPTGV